MKHSAKAAGLLAAVILAGCASPGYRAPVNQPVQPQAYPAGAYPGAVQPAATQPYIVAYGTVESIQPVSSQGAGGIGWGTVGGGVVGGLLGSQIGSGTGKTAATVAGAVGGAAVGQHMQNRPATAYQVGVRLDNGNYVTVAQESVGNLRVGSRVSIDSSNRVYPL